MLTLFCLIAYGKLPDEIVPVWFWLLCIVLQFCIALALIVKK